MRVRAIILAAIVIAGCAMGITGCSGDAVVSDEYPDIYPDYVGVTVPRSMTDLRFQMADGSSCRIDSRQDVNVMWFTVTDEKQVQYKPFPVYISDDEIDPYVAYRLIEPGYESWFDMGIYQRELTTFKEKAIVHNTATNRGCVNCHTFDAGCGDRFLFHARGQGGGTVLVDGDDVRILNLSTVGPKRQGTYPTWHPDGRYVAFSSNTTKQSFTINDPQPIEVYDTASDIIVWDLDTDEVTLWPEGGSEDVMETFPTFSPDGKTLYYCAAPAVEDVARERGAVRYRLMAVDFADGAPTGEPRQVWGCDSLSVSFPRVNGDWMLFTVSSFATFPIWHREADLMLMNLSTGEVLPADALNSPDTESYHSWSSNGHWVVFSSRRDDARYTRLYIAHFDGEGHFDKPFMLPQRTPEHNQLRLKSYNIPEFTNGSAVGHERAIARLFK